MTGEPERGGSGPGGGLFLAFEGVEGSGKSTQAKLLADHLVRAGYDVVFAREPGSTPLGEQIRDLVLNRQDLSVPPRSELFLMLAARAAFVRDVVRPALESGRVVIADRFELSTMAYQGAGRDLPIDEVRRANQFATENLSPDITLFLDLSPEEGARRQEAASKARDRMEAEAAEFHRRVGDGYRRLADQVEGLVRVDAVGPIEEIHRRILEILHSSYPETFPTGRVIS